MNSYVLLWNVDTWRKYSDKVVSGEDVAIEYIAAAATKPFMDIRTGDEIFVISVRSHEFLLGGRLIADSAPISSDAAKRRLGEGRDYSWDKYVLGREDRLDNFRPATRIDLEMVRRLELLDANGNVTSPKIKQGGRIEVQHFRQPRRISQESALDLRTVLGLDAGENTDDGCANDIEAVLSDKTIDPTTRKQLIDARLGQGAFRKNVISVWGRGEQCAVTGVPIKEILIASHIRPWKKSTDEERLAGWNGVLLVSHLDKLFDRFLISFEESGKIVASSRLARHWGTLKLIGINRNLTLDFSRVAPMSEARIKRMLRDHRAELERLDQTAGRGS